MKTAIVTGASQGLGNYIANTFSGAGWKVIGIGRSGRPNTLESAIQYEQFDASDSDVCTAFFEKHKSELSKDEVCLVNNAGSYVSGGIVETLAEEYRRQMDSNYFSAVNMTKGLVGTVSKAKIINVVSAGALTSYAKQSAYGAAKAAERHFFQSIQKELDRNKYQITNLYPGDIASHGPSEVAAIDPKDLANLITEIAESKRTYVITDVTLYPTLG
jgi:3-oxoacyl-[acyl-carrier protein] reductase